jgi:hypothetical protein
LRRIYYYSFSSCRDVIENGYSAKLVLLSDGSPTDMFPALHEATSLNWMQLPWVRNFAVGIGPDANEWMLSKGLTHPIMGLDHLLMTGGEALGTFALRLAGMLCGGRPKGLGLERGKINEGF